MKSRYCVHLIQFLVFLGLTSCKAGFFSSNEGMTPPPPVTGTPPGTPPVSPPPVVANPCETYDAASIGTLSSNVALDEVTVDWTNDLSSNADSFEVELRDDTSIIDTVSSKPAVFTSVPDGTYSAQLSYMKAGCTDKISNIASIEVDATIDCTSWDTFAIASLDAVVGGSPAVDLAVTWDKGTVSGEDSFEVSISGGMSSPSPQTSEPVTFSDLNPGDYTATLSFKKSGCSDITASEAFTIDVSFQAHIFDWMKNNPPSRLQGCTTSGCHSGGSFQISDAAALYNELTVETISSTCTTDLEDPSTRVEGASGKESFIYRRMAGTECGPRMPTTGANWSDTEMAALKDWIEAGALNN